MSIVGTRRTELFSPTVLVVLGSDWPMDETAQTLLEDVARQSCLAVFRREVLRSVPQEWSQANIAQTLEEGVSFTLQRWPSSPAQGIARSVVNSRGR
ncbi:unnamed protein product [Sphacelaria rigidula]